MGKLGICQYHAQNTSKKVIGLESNMEPKPHHNGLNETAKHNTHNKQERARVLHFTPIPALAKMATVHFNSCHWILPCRELTGFYHILTGPYRELTISCRELNGPYYELTGPCRELTGPPTAQHRGSCREKP